MLILFLVTKFDCNKKRYNYIDKLMAKFSNWVIHSKLFFWMAFIIMLSISLLMISLFLLNIYEVNGLKFNEINLATYIEKVRLWSRIILTSIGSTFVVLSFLMVNRHNKNFFYFGITGSLILASNAFISDLFFDACKWLCVATVLSIQTVLWHIKKDGETKFKRITNMYLIIIVIIVLIVGVISGALVNNIPESSLFYNKKPFLDPIQFAFTITGNVLIMLYFVESRLIYIIGNIITIVMFSMIVASGDLISIIQLVQALLYFVITISAYLIMKNNRVWEKGKSFHLVDAYCPLLWCGDEMKPLTEDSVCEV